MWRSLREIIPDFWMRPLEVSAAHELDHARQCHEALNNVYIAQDSPAKRLLRGGKHIYGSIENESRVHQIVGTQCLLHHTEYLPIGGLMPDGTNLAAWHAVWAPRTRDGAPTTTKGMARVAEIRACVSEEMGQFSF